MKTSMKHSALLGIAALMAGCTVGPDYVRPVVAAPVEWHPEAPWTVAAPADGQIRADWWTLFSDPTLNQLEQQARDASPTLKLSYEHAMQGMAELGEVRSAELPSIGLGADAERSRISANRPLQNYAIPNTSTVQNDVRAGVQANYEVDLFGRVRREVEAAKAQSDQSADDYQDMRLIVAAEVATAYFALRETDDEMRVVRSMIEWQGKALTFEQNRYQDGAASSLDVSQQQTQLEATRTQLALLTEQRAHDQNALATLTGVPAPTFSLAEGRLPSTIPTVPVGVPSDLLQRRPDIAAAERAMAAANAKIGVARSAYYPSIEISPAIALESVAGGSLFTASSLLWSIGGSAFENVFDGGKIAAENRFAESGYRAAVDTYSSVVLTAFQEVQDGMASMTDLSAADRSATLANASSEHTLSLATQRYRDGVANSLDVIEAQQTALVQQRLVTTIRGREFAQCVFLLKAIGGGWDAGTGTQATNLRTASSKPDKQAS